MQQRLDYYRASPEGIKALIGVENYIKGSGLEAGFLHMLKLRASQINGCAYCIDMHWKDARAAGESEQRLYGLDAWREAPYYTDRERAALEWTESLTNIAQTHAPDEAFEAVRKHFNDKELSDLTLAIATINAWNRIAIGFRSTAGTYRSPSQHREPAGQRTAVAQH